MIELRDRRPVFLGTLVPPAQADRIDRSRESRKLACLFRRERAALQFQAERRTRGQRRAVSRLDRGQIAFRGDMKLDRQNHLVTEPARKIVGRDVFVLTILAASGLRPIFGVHKVSEIVQQRCRDERGRRPFAFREHRTLDRVLELRDRAFAVVLLPGTQVIEDRLDDIHAFLSVANDYIPGCRWFADIPSTIDHAAMIERYSDHAANERTFLAWVRTAIAIMAFGFVVEKFDLFLRIAGISVAARKIPGGHQFVGDIAGLLLILLGGALMAFAVVRFRKTAADIDAQEVRRGPGGRADFTLVALLILLGAALFVYLAYTLTVST
jgi:putative membrane protein